MSDRYDRCPHNERPSRCVACKDCVIVRLTRELAESEARVETLQNRWASRPLSHPDGEALIEENERLRGLLNRWVYWHDNANCTSAPPELLGESRDAALGGTTDQPDCGHRQSDPDCPACPPPPDQPSEGGKEQVFVWLVERPGPNGVIWATANMHWTDDATDACWFARKQDAELFQFNLGGNSTVTQHVFIYIASPPAADGAEDNSAACSGDDDDTTHRA